MAKGEGKGECEKLTQWGLSYEGLEEPSQCRKWVAGIICSSGKVQWYTTLVGESDQATVIGEGPERSALYPPWQQIVHKPGLAFHTSGRSCLTDLFHEWRSFDTRKETKWEDPAQKFWKKKGYDFMQNDSYTGSYPLHHQIWCPHNPTSPW